MRMSQFYLPTLKETPAEAEIVSHQLMLRAGLIRKLASGIYSYLPLGVRVLQKIENIIREEMVRAGAQEVFLPLLHPAELWKESGRWYDMGPEMMRVKDRKDHDFCIGPTHEEVITDLVRNEVRSYKQLPLNLFQIQTKVRDEIRPRFGVMRSREFIMKDGYSFDLDEKGLDETYQKMFEAYTRIFERIGLEFRAVEADTGAIGGKSSHEFMVLAESGEDAIAYCEDCEYAANLELAQSEISIKEEYEELKDLEKISTPNIKSIKDLEKFFDLDGCKMIKTLLYVAGDTMVAALVRGCDELNEVKLRNHLGVANIRMATDEEIIEKTGAPAGFVGPVGLKNIRIIADPLVMRIKNGVTGANEADYHYRNVNPGRDFTVAEEDVVDLRTVQEGEACVHCGKPLRIARGIEVGHIFKLGTKYSEAMGATILDENGKERPMIMGCYGIGVTRIIGAAIEQNHDENGIIWPMPIAPFHVIILPIGKDDQIMEVAEDIYEKLIAQGIEAVLDDRKERPGVKFNDADLIGIPIRVTIGNRGLKENVVEVKYRDTGEEVKVEVDKIVEFIVDEVRSRLS
ncbi:proline--tRNA ligase [Anoxybacter fermentans]|uniref:Proline--tRNA ligase n=1 Tax=Anoxybacter fermentans TaxID=1323375 RepID=A0A3Q9HPA1_9FIRM|nr:proline--tRNA ligase [Anoxybacter fermentans]AZR72383.1 proline--tRNA ligase [Anoxybacter fermentans]